MRTTSKGFTLIELLVVIAIIGLLSTLAVVALNTARAKSRDSKRVADIKQMQTALELYFTDAGTYPVVAAAGVVLGQSGSTQQLCSNGGWKGACAAGDTVYMGHVPAAPTPADTATCATTNPYLYTSTDTQGTSCTSGTCGGYKIAFCIGSAVGELVAGNQTASQAGI